MLQFRVNREECGVCVISGDSSYGKTAAYRNANSKWQTSPDEYTDIGMMRFLKRQRFEDVFGSIS